MMKLLFTSLSMLAVGLLASCGPITANDQVRLSKNAMSFNQQGADFGECGVLSQLERGRASSSQSAGGG